MAYFKYFKTIDYDLGDHLININTKPITNILQRVRLKLDLVNTRMFFAQHFIVEGQTPEFLAHEFYGDSELHWVILYAHHVTNPYYDWPLTYPALQKFITKKYGSANHYEPKHYEDDEGYEVDERYFDGVNWVNTVGALPVTNSMYEERRNDAKRNLNLIRPEYVNDVVRELKDLLHG
tara:strand:- start:300 stop:833 length:534 start_codon:yes stop_codon:yes gene_type:complete